ncbi:MAG: cytochrome c biogenesis protein CcsA [Rhodospirillales bacterium]
MTLEDPTTATLLLGITALMSLMPAVLLPWRQEPGNWLTWCLHLVALAGCGAALSWQVALGWSDRLSLALWLSTAIMLLLYPAVAARWRGSSRLAPLLYGYLLLLAFGATLLPSDPGGYDFGVTMTGWLVAHIVFALIAYGLAGLASIAGLAVFLQELALKRRRPNALSQRLPALADGERLQMALLGWTEAALAATILSGMAHEMVTSGQLLRLDHKTLLVLAAFLVIGLLLLLSWQRGLRGRQAARILLLAYLLLTLAYPGVKFVGDLLTG